MKINEKILIIILINLLVILVSISYAFFFGLRTLFGSLFFYSGVIESFYYEFNNMIICRITNIKYCVLELIKQNASEILLQFYKDEIGRIYHVNCVVGNVVIDITSPRHKEILPDIIARCKIIKEDNPYVICEKI